MHYCSLQNINTQSNVPGLRMEVEDYPNVEEADELASLEYTNLESEGLTALTRQIQVENTKCILCQKLIIFHRPRPQLTREKVWIMTTFRAQEMTMTMRRAPWPRGT